MPVKYPIAEIFSSIQGEGLHTGTPMTFVRLAGCNVGKFGQELVQLQNHDSAKYKQALCRDVFGEEFVCDTDYHSQVFLTPSEILDRVDQPIMLLTGGEPAAHDLEALLDEANKRSISMHMETSGTKPLADLRLDWIACSPKSGYLRENTPCIKEFKFLAGEDFSLAHMKQFLLDNHVHIDSDLGPLVYLQPINYTNTILGDNLERAIKIVKDVPGLRLSVQMHKFLQVR